MKKSLFVIMGLLLTHTLFAGDLVKINLNDETSLKQYLRDPNLTVHYYTDHFFIATAEESSLYPCEILDVNAWNGPVEYFIAWFRPQDASLYKADLSPYVTFLHESADHMILKAAPENVVRLFPAIHNGLVRIADRPVRLPEHSFPFGAIQYEEDPFVVELMSYVSNDSILASVQHMQDYGTRECHTPEAIEAQNWIKARFESYGLETELMDFTMPGGAASDNVIATLPGTVYPEEYVILGGHYDSRSWSGLAPGADDNATGTAGILEIARILSQYEFKRTIIFCAWSGEEYGLYGSEAYAAWAENQGLNILGYFNQDMTGYLQNGSEMHTDVMAAAISVELREFYRDVTAVYLPELEVNDGSMTGGDSDHSSFNAHGFMGIFPFEDSENYSPYIHSSNDLIGPSVNTIEQSGIFTQSVLASVVTMANMLTGPQNLLAVPNDGSVTLSWKKLVEAESYNIYRNNPEVPYINVTDTTYIDLEVENGTAYTYFVTAIYAENGEESVPSNEVTVIPMPPLSFPFEEDFETGAPYWSMEGTWGLSSEVFHSPSHSLTDSPNGNYANNLNISTYLRSVDLTGATGGTISFYTKYDLESGYDYAYLEVSLNGTNWTQVAQFNGTQNAWVLKSYELGPYLDNPYVIFRFRLNTDVYVQEDGINIDDLEIVIWGVGIDGPSDSQTLINIYPNPFGRLVQIELFPESPGNADIWITNQEGRTIRQLFLDTQLGNIFQFTWDGKDSNGTPLTSGIYLIHFRINNEKFTRKLVLIR